MVKPVFAAPVAIRDCSFNKELLKILIILIELSSTPDTEATLTVQESSAIVFQLKSLGIRPIGDEGLFTGFNLTHPDIVPAKIKTRNSNLILRL
jgi:hypothetical protein